MVSFGDAIEYPASDDDWIKTVVIGGVLTFLWFLLLVPALIVSGYLVKVMKSTVEGDAEPPEFDDWGTLLVDGIQVFVIGIIYMIIPIIVWLVTVGGSIVSMMSGTEEGAIAGLGGILFGLLLYFVLSIVFGYFLAVGVVNFAYEGNFGAAFSVDALRNVGLNGNFAIAWVGAFVVNFIAAVLLSILNIIPILGFILGIIIGPFLSFYVGVVAARLLGGGFQDAMAGTPA